MTVDNNNSEQESNGRELEEKVDDFEKKVLFLANNVQKIEPPDKREEFKKELMSLVLNYENYLKTLSENGE